MWYLYLSFMSARASFILSCCATNIWFIFDITIPLGFWCNGDRDLYDFDVDDTNDVVSMEDVTNLRGDD